MAAALFHRSGQRCITGRGDPGKMALPWSRKVCIYIYICIHEALQWCPRNRLAETGRPAPAFVQGYAKACAETDRPVPVPPQAYAEAESQANKSFFSEIIASISDISFSEDGRYILSRDYMTLKLWDINKENAPVATYNVHEQLRARLCDLYENDSIFDKFDCCINGSGTGIATGSYNNLFRVFNAWDGTDATLEASRDPMRKRLQAPPSRNRLAGRKGAAPQGTLPAGAAELGTDYMSKLLHLAWHPEANVIAVAASNSLYMYCA
eukprot:361250-Chlamydomonas_euryale.AAC.29